MLAATLDGSGCISALIFWLACIEVIILPPYLFCAELLADEFTNIDSSDSGVFTASTASICAFSIGILSRWKNYIRKNDPVCKILPLASAIHLSIAIFGFYILSPS